MIDNSCMASYLYFKQFHVLAAWTSLFGFVLRGIWMLRGSPLLHHRMSRILPHVLDTALLGSALMMVWQLSPNVPGWLYAKIPGVLAYIVLGSFALKRAPTKKARVICLLAAIVVFLWVASVAVTKSAWGYFAVF